MSFHFYDRPSEFHGLGGEDEPGDDVADDEARCVCCGEAVLKVATVKSDGDDVCLECAHDDREAAREEATVVS